MIRCTHQIRRQKPDESHPRKSRPAPRGSTLPFLKEPNQMAGQSSFPVCYLSASPTGPLLRTLPVIASLITNLPLIVLPLFDRASALPSFVNLGRMSTTVPCGTLVTPEAKLIRDAFAASRVDLCFTKRSALIAHVGRSQTTTRTGTLQPTLPQGRGRRSRMGRMGRGRPGRPAGRGLMLIRIGRASTSEPMPIVSASAALTHLSQLEGPTGLQGA